jgi:hypothetical protein
VINAARTRQAASNGDFDNCWISYQTWDDPLWPALVKIHANMVRVDNNGFLQAQDVQTKQMHQINPKDLLHVETYRSTPEDLGLDEDTMLRLAACGWSPQDLATAWTQILNAYRRPSVPNLDTESKVWFNRGTERGKAPRRKETQMNRIDQVALDIIDAIGNEGGEFEREPGQVLHGLAEATGHDYKEVSLGVLYLERMEMVEVDRYDAPEAHRANRLVRVRLI